MYYTISIAYIFKYCQDNQSKKSKYFLKSYLNLRNLFSIIVKQIALDYLLNDRITVMCHGNGISSRANRNAARKFSDTKQENYNQTKGGNEMENTSFMRVDEVAQELGVSKSYAYKIVQRLNAELKEKGILTISGRVNRKYFMERTCYGAERKE